MNRILLDTHLLLWAVSEPRKLPPWGNPGREPDFGVIGASSSGICGLIPAPAALEINLQMQRIASGGWLIERA